MKNAKRKRRENAPQALPESGDEYLEFIHVFIYLMLVWWRKLSAGGREHCACGAGAASQPPAQLPHAPTPHQIPSSVLLYNTRCLTSSSPQAKRLPNVSSHTLTSRAFGILGYRAAERPRAVMGNRARSLSAACPNLSSFHRRFRGPTWSAVHRHQSSNKRFAFSFYQRDEVLNA